MNVCVWPWTVAPVTTCFIIARKDLKVKVRRRRRRGRRGSEIDR